MDPTTRAQALAEWRGYREESVRPDRCRPAGDAVAEVLKSLGLGERLREAEVLDAWRELVGDFIAGHAEPRALRDGVLLVSVLQPTVHFELDRVWKPKILQRMREKFGVKTVREIRFRLG